jgi:hypothetical protein
VSDAQPQIDLLRQQNERYGALVMVFGIVLLTFGMFGCLITSLQSTFAQIIPTPATADERQFLRMWWKVLGIVASLMLATLLAGVGFAFVGYRLRRGSPRAIRLAWWMVLGSFAWATAYLVSAMGLSLDPDMHDFVAAMPMLQPYVVLLRVIQGLFAAGMLYVPLAVVAFAISRIRPVPSQAPK